ncbi:MAG: type IX secretion system membrane protein PorP/SprF [Bacteroidota bacterium]
MKRVIYIALMILAGNSLFAQQEVMVSQYMFNGLFLNPAYAGSHDYAEATALYRNQWVNFDGAPVTQVIGYDTPIMNRQGGLGFTVVNDDIGDTHTFEVFANAAYHMNLDAEGKNRLAMGLKLGVTHYSSNYDLSRIVDSGDPVFENNIDGQLIPKFGGGIYYYNDISYVGLSLPTFFVGDNSIIEAYDSLSVENGYFETHYFLNGGVVFKLNNDLAMKPNLLFKYHPAAPLEVDINCNFLLKEVLWLGASYRTGDALTALVEYNFTPKFRAGFAYDFTLTDIANYSNGSYEVMLGYQFGENIVKAKSPRYF